MLPPLTRSKLLAIFFFFLPPHPLHFPPPLQKFHVPVHGGGCCALGTPPPLLPVVAEGPDGRLVIA